MYIKLTKNEQNNNMCKDTEISKEYGKSLEASRGVSDKHKESIGKIV
jgi:hypothetical protein